MTSSTLKHTDEPPVPLATDDDPYPDVTAVYLYHKGTIGVVIARYFKQVQPNTELYDDCWQAGSVALVRSIRKWKPGFNCKVNTYAFKAIYWEILQLVYKLNRFNNHTPTYPDFDATVCNRTLAILDQLDDEETAVRYSQVYRVLYNTLTKVERCALNLRLEGKQLRDIGEAMGFSKSRASQLLITIREKAKKLAEQLGGIQK